MSVRCSTSFGIQSANRNGVRVLQRHKPPWVHYMGKQHRHLASGQQVLSTCINFKDLAFSAAVKGLVNAYCCAVHHIFFLIQTNQAVNLLPLQACDYHTEFTVMSNRQFHSNSNFWWNVCVFVYTNSWGSSTLKNELTSLLGSLANPPRRFLFHFSCTRTSFYQTWIECD